MDLYLGELTDGEHSDHRLVAARTEGLAVSWFGLASARLGRMTGRTWQVHSVARVTEVEIADDPEGRMKVRLDPPHV